jgi:hypothetical protein
LSAAFEVDVGFRFENLLGKEKAKDTKIKINGGGQECPPHTL